MANGFGSLYIGQSGLMSAQNALNTTANNLANVNTTGYVRQQVRFADQEYSTLKIASSTTNLQQAGLGVSIGDVVHARDVFLDKAFRLESGREAFYSTCYEVTTQVEDLLQELDGEEFANSITDLYKAIEEMAKDPADSTNQNLLLQKCELFLSRSASLYSDFKSYQSNLNNQIKDAVDTINEIGNRIYELNIEIQRVESAGVETSMTLRDERDQLLDELSAYAKIDVVEDQTGFVSVELEGSEFIIDRGCMNMGVLYDSDTTFYTPYWPHLSNDETKSYIEVFNLTYDAKTENNTDIGKVKSLLIQRGDHFGNKSDMESLEAYSKIESSTMMEVEAELDQMYSKVVDIINNLFAPNLSVEDSAATFQSAFDTIPVSDEDIDAENSTYKLLSGKSASNTYYEVGTANGKTQIVAVESAQILDVDNAYYGIDHELPPREIFVRNSESRYTEVVSPLNGETYYVLNAEDPENSNTWYHIGTTRINDELQKQITLMPAYQGDGDVAYDLGEALSVKWASATLTLNPTDNNVTNFESYYNKMIDKLATDGSIYSAASDTLKATTASLESSRQQVTGVSSDEELTNMVKFQSAYNASSRFMTVISQMTETIVGLI